MLTALMVALAPFVLNAVLAGAKWVTAFSKTSGKRCLLALVSIVGVIAGAALNRTGRPNSISSLLTTAFESLAAFLMGAMLLLLVLAVRAEVVAVSRVCRIVPTRMEISSLLGVLSSAEHSKTSAFALAAERRGGGDID
jgi:ABC-type dipeptide/oligopeptide/nickel transport system permease component